ncbi:hypothetical protein Ade02nite_51160 [Paractinoplanes deccanensis]|uniref:Uncharacterized protein n=1 Tax=Paractinoplanes deccanensis TaxID=113561 RepID=A0ABQ3Y8Z5_9ACTN|nr:hypothetical protein Ade02nite_51160 [Actinoplanes deccanensis]
MVSGRATKGPSAVIIARNWEIMYAAVDNSGLWITGTLRDAPPGRRSGPAGEGRGGSDPPRRRPQAPRRPGNQKAITAPAPTMAAPTITAGLMPSTKDWWVA